MSNIISKDWTIVEDILASKEKLELIEFLEKGETLISSKELRKRAVKLKANLGIDDCEYFLNHQDEIPKEFRTKYLVFPGTLLRDSGGRSHVVFLYWSGGRWRLGFYWLGGGFGGNGRLVRRKSKKCLKCGK